MNNFQQIQQKLKQFSSKYYTNELIKGSILFVALGLLYLLFTLFIEYFLWLKPTARTFLFWVFIAVELFLLIRFIGFPLFKLFGLQRGISAEESSKIIGNHFPEVKDKLLNILQLKQNSTQSDLLLASIDQKANELQPIPFTKAVDFKTNTKYIKYALIPIGIWLLTLIFGKNNELNNSLQRVVNHNIAYNPPAPFLFALTNPNLEVIQGKPLTIYMETKGEVVPQEVKIHFNQQEYFLQKENDGLFSYTFQEVNTPFNFHVSANKLASKKYSVKIIHTPTIEKVSMFLKYPKYLGKKNESISNTGNLIVPRGTFVTWNVKTTHTESVSFLNDSKKEMFKKDKKNEYFLTKRINNAINYQISSSNQSLKNYEQLNYSIDIIEDTPPNISVKSNIDSLVRGKAFFAGQVTDDHGISKLELIYYDLKNPEAKKSKRINTTQESVQSFFYEFPDGLNLKKGVDYELFFQVFDNDAVLGSKKATSQIFSFHKKTEKEIKSELLKEQQNNIKDLEKSIQKQERNKKELEQFQIDLQSKKNINWNDQKKVENIVKRHQRYQKMMQKQTEKLKENFLEKPEQTEQLQDKKEDIQKRIEELKKIQKQKKLIKELQEMSKKLNKDKLIQKAKKLAQQSKQQEKSLERILEMTKRFYVEQKTNQLAEKLKDLAKKQEELAKKENATKKEQEELKKEFNEIKKELKELKKDNEKLKSPMEIPKMEELKRDTEKQLNDSEKAIEQNNKTKAKEKQNKASKNMKQMSKKMKRSMESMSLEMEEENKEDLRQILENVLIFSFKQEDLINQFNAIKNANHPDFGKNIKQQQQLKEYFEHIDDSLFALSIRVPKISTKVQEQIANTHYSINESIEYLAENQFINGIKNQRYSLTAVNTLADMLSNTLDAMQNPSMSMGSGKGKKGKPFSLPDIIEKQSELLKKMEKGMQKKQGKPKDGGKEKKQDGKGKPGGEQEQMSGELYEIYKEQSQLREQLEKGLKSGKKIGKKALQEMKQLEDEIIKKGFNQSTINRMQRLNYELLKLKKASFEQGKEKKRKSVTNQEEYDKNNAKKIEFKKRYYNQTEILNRESLPLRQNYKKKVQEYFSTPIQNKNN